MNLLIRNVVYRNPGWKNSLMDLPADQSFYIPFFINFFLACKIWLQHYVLKQFAISVCIQNWLISCINGYLVISRYLNIDFDLMVIQILYLLFNQMSHPDDPLRLLILIISAKINLNYSGSNNDNMFLFLIFILEIIEIIFTFIIKYN
jgi:hypothetical protein